MYDISKSTSPKMLELKNGTEIIKFLSLETRKTISPMPFSAFVSHLRGVKVIYCNNRFLEFPGQINHFIGPSGVEKHHLDEIVEDWALALA